MDPFFLWLERTALSVWMRESLSVFAFPAILTLHTIGLAMLAGPSIAVDLRILTRGRGDPIAPLDRFFPLMWAGFWVNAVTGVLLVVAYPAKALTNPLFFVTMTLVVTGVLVLRALRRRVFATPDPDAAAATSPVRRLATTSIVVWLATIAAGRWLAYTYSRLLASFDTL